jgi:hypothetical protein
MTRAKQVYDMSNYKKMQAKRWHVVRNNSNVYQKHLDLSYVFSIEHFGKYIY